MSQFIQGRYEYYSKNLDSQVLVSDDIVKRYDRKLLQSLIFRKSFWNQIKHFFRNQTPTLKVILKQEPVLSRRYTKKELIKFSLLWIAILGGYHDSAELLVRSGANVNELFGCYSSQIISKKSSILHQLVKMDPSSENERLIKLVIDHGADLGARNCKEDTILHVSVENERVQITKMFLEKGADANVANIFGMTPLLIAARGRKVNELLPLLMKHGADVLATASYGENVLHKLAWSRVEPTDDVFRALVEKGISLDGRNESQDQPIHVATLAGNNKLVNLLLDYGVNVNARTENGEFPLYIAASDDKYLEMVKILLKRGADIHFRTDRGETVLHNACSNVWKLSPNIIRILLSAGADVLIEDQYGETPLAIIAKYKINTNYFKTSAELIIKALALKKACLPSIGVKEETIIKKDPMLWDYYQQCQANISRMKLRRFHENCTFFQLVTKSHVRIAALMWDPKFQSNFRLYDLNEFSMYAEDILQAFEVEQYHYNFMLEQEDIINEAIDNILPPELVTMVARYLCNCVLARICNE